MPDHAPQEPCRGSRGSGLSRMQTRCSSCGTRFRVSEEQLAIAKGLVRCGACNTVFDARAERVPEPGEAPVAAPPPREVTEDYIAELLSEEEKAPRSGVSPPQPSLGAAIPEATPATPAPSPVIARMPVEIPQETPRDTAWGRRRLGWAGVALALVLLPLLQYAWLARERHAQDPELRRWYERGCALIGCELPPYSDPQRIRSEGLVLRPDPEDERQLAMDAMLVNTSRYAQRFPLLELRFSDNQGRVIATRVFQPQEYLGGAALREGIMPPGEPVRAHVRFEDPGEEATGYELRLNAPAD